MPADPAWLVQLEELAERLSREDDAFVLAGEMPVQPGETIEDVRVRVAARGGRRLTLIQGGRDDA